MQTRVQKWGHSLAIRIPKSFAVQACLEQNTPVDLSVQEGVLRIAPCKPTYTLEALLEQVTPQNLHAEQEIGPAEGKEEWR